MRPIYLILTACACCIGAATPPARAYEQSYYAQSSVLAAGKRVKIRVNDEGIYQISYDTLRQWGFADPSRVRVLGYGGARLTTHKLAADLPDDLTPTGQMHTDDGRILFYGCADVTTMIIDSNNNAELEVRRNLYDTAGYYFLVDDVDVPGMAVARYGGDKSSTRTTYMHTDLIEHEVQTPSLGGGYFHDTPIAVGEKRPYTFRVRDFNTADYAGVTKGSRAIFGYRYGQCAPKSQRIDIEAPELAYSYTRQGYAEGAGAKQYYTVDTGVMLFTSSSNVSLADNELTWKFGRGTDATYTAIDYTYMIYPRTARLGTADRYVINSHFGATEGNNFSFSVTNPAGTHLWNITDPANVYAFEGSVNAGNPSRVNFTYDKNYSLGDGTVGRFVIFDEAATFPEAAYVGDVTPQNLHGESTPEMVIVTVPGLLAYAEELAEAHRRIQGLDVRVYTEDVICNEFSSGSRTPMALRRFLKMFDDRTPGRLRYLLMYGGSSWDPRGISFHPSEQLLTVYANEVVSESGNHSRNFASDLYFGMLDDDFQINRTFSQPCKLGVGRIPAVNADEAIRANKKIIAYLENPPAATSHYHAVMLSDDGDSKQHLKQSEEAIATLIENCPSMTVTRAHNYIYPWDGTDARTLRSVVTSALKAGAGLFGYCGHGNPQGLSGEHMWDKNAIQNTAYEGRPLAMISSCDIFAFDQLDSGFAHTMLLQPDGGAIGVIAAGRSVVLDYNQYLNLAVLRRYAQARQGDNIGDIWRDARNSIINLSIDGPRINAMCYNLCGDPAVPVPAPSASDVLKISSINGVDAATTDGLDIEPMKTAIVTGSVTDADGNVMSDFNGEVCVDLYDGSTTASTLTQGGDSKIETVTLDETLLATATAKVSAGEFTAKIYIPVAQTPGVNSRLVAIANDESGTRSAACTLSDVRVADTASTLDAKPDVDGMPVIEQAYINTPDYTAGMVTGSTVTVVAEIYVSDAGLRRPEAGVGGASYLILDGATRYIDFASAISKPDAEGLARVSYTLRSLTQGPHSIELAVVSATGETATRTLDFTVESDGFTGALTVDGDGPARSEVTIKCSHTSLGDVTGTVFITDASGATVFSEANVSFPYVWPLTDNSGRKVPDGRYRIELRAVSADYPLAGAVEPVDIVVLQQ